MKNIKLFALLILFAFNGAVALATSTAANGVPEVLTRLSAGSDRLVFVAHQQAQAPQEIWDRVKMKILDDGRMQVNYFYSEAILNDPITLLMDLFLLGRIDSFNYSQSPRIEFNRIHEYLFNAQHGDASAQLAVLAFIKQYSKDYARLGQGETVVKPDALRMFDLLGKNPNSEQAKEFIQQFLNSVESRFQWLQQRHKVQEAKNRKAWEQWKKQTGILDALDKASPQLDELVRKNDRHGARKLIETYLPWTIMAPYETAAWKTWLDDLERKPTPEDVTLAYRGVNYDSDIPFWTKDGKPGFMSTMLTRNQGSYNRRLRSYSARRKQNSKDVSVKELGENPGGNIASMLQAHAAEPKASVFLSFSQDLEKAASFAGDFNYAQKKTFGGFLIVKTSKKRAFPNGLNKYPDEFEIILPLIVFPEDVVYYKESTYPAQFKKSLADLRADILPELSPEDRALLEQSENRYANHDKLLIDYAKIFESIAEKVPAIGLRCEGIFR